LIDIIYDTNITQTFPCFRGELAPFSPPSLYLFAFINLIDFTFSRLSLLLMLPLLRWKLDAANKEEFFNVSIILMIFNNFSFSRDLISGEM